MTCFTVDERDTTNGGYDDSGKNNIIVKLDYKGRDNCYMTHLIGPVYLSGSPGGVLHIVLLHLGTNLWTCSDVTCRLEKTEEKNT